MKKWILLAIGFFFIIAINAQTKLPPIDKSAMDMAYYPNNYPLLKIQNKATEPLVARVIYSRPLRNGRNVFGELVEYNKVWRLGANEATELELFKDVKINGKKIKKGRYTLYSMCNQTNWTLIINKETDTWGAFKYDETKDALRIELTMQKQAEPAEAFTMVFEKSNTGADLIMAWDNTKVSLPITF
ncbi:MAG TPA: DUF2911 domain-containing protein [Chitinophagaceae bacterium]|nr:DUF2911 domain-containing protein [Chitinophagaceae bacterium]